MGTRGFRWAIGLFGIVFGAIAVAIQIRHGANSDRALIDFAVGETYVLGGLYAWGRQPANRTWKLMTGTGLAWFIGDYAASGAPVIEQLAILFADTDAILLVALILAYPEGRVEAAFDRAVIVINAVGLTATNALFLATGVSTPNLVLGLAVTSAVSVRVPLRWLRAPRARRRILGPPLLAVSITLFAIGVAIVVRLLGISEDAVSAILSARDIGVLAIPIGFVVGSFQLVEDELVSSRARIVTAADAERRRIERDLHDGAQQRFVALSIALRVLRTRLGPHVQPDVASALDAASDELKAGIEELRELAQGIHPAVLTDEGLAGAIPALAERSAIPTRVAAVPDVRLPAPVEAAAYFVVSEALTNASKHSRATEASVTAWLSDDRLRLNIADNGVGGADSSTGSGLVGLVDRVAAIGGQLLVVSPPGGGTEISAVIPLAIDRDLAASG